MKVYSVARLLLLPEPQGEEAEAGDLDDLEPDTRKVTDGPAAPTHTGDQNPIVIIDEPQRTVARDEGGDDLAVLLELDTDGLSDGGVWLLGLDGDLADDDAGSHGDTLERGLVDGGSLPLAELLRRPEIVPVVNAELTRRLATARLGLAHEKGQTITARIDKFMLDDTKDDRLYLLKLYSILI